MPKQDVIAQMFPQDAEEAAEIEAAEKAEAESDEAEGAEEAEGEEEGAAEEGKEEDAGEEGDGDEGEKDGEEAEGEEGGESDAAKKQRVPLPELLEERKRRKEAEERAARVDERLNILQNQWQSYQQRQQQASEQQNKTEPPKYEEDPLGYLKYGIDQAQQQYGKVNESLEAQRQQATALQQQQTIRQLETEFEQSHPDYSEAVQHLKEVRDRELELIGYADPASRQQQIAQEATQIVQNALKTGRNPIEVVYNLAGANGYKPKPAETQNDGASDREKIETIAKAQGDAKSLSGAGGKAKGSKSLEALASMSEAEFAKFSADMDDAKWRKLLGG